MGIFDDISGKISKAIPKLPGTKGVICYSYICVLGYSIEFTVPGDRKTRTSQREFASDWLEVDGQKIDGAGNYSGIFRCRVLQNDREMFNNFVEINALTGMLLNGSMNDIAQQRSEYRNGVFISYGFYDAPNDNEFNVAKMPVQDQFYISITPNCSDWMAKIAPVGSTAAGKPFRRLVLPAAHDVGMNSLDNSLALLQRSGGRFQEVLANGLPDIAKGPLANMQGGAVQVVKVAAPNIIQSSSITQKDSMETLLALGARYFEFRPAYLPQAVRDLKSVPDTLYFMHLVIPGMRYDLFLADCVKFLLRNPGEIIVVQIRDDGVHSSCARPSDDDLKHFLDQAISYAQGELQAGNLKDMKGEEIDNLRKDKKRLIVFKEANQNNIYDDNANKTLSGDSIIANYEKMSATGQKDKDLTNIQCQATATNIWQVWLSALSLTAPNSWLLSTKARCTNKTLPWIRANALERLTEDQMIAIMDDFVDGAMCDVAQQLSARRLRDP